MPGTLKLLARGIRRKCPRCGRGNLFRGWFTIVETCPQCGLRFEREEGAWLGSMALMIGVTEIAFAVFVAAGLLLTWPDVPWLWLTVAAVAFNLAVPLVAYPFAKTTWSAVDMMLHKMDPQDAASIRQVGRE
ncbi:MAG: DUF983 domain-containing protein [Actinomycetota bacterium]|nr:DUF983 domain-containing protein [Actinomycetota bacterium]